METITYHAKILTYKENPGGYIVYAFEDIDNPGTYGLCTLLPNWELNVLKIGDTGYIKCREIRAGKDTWFNFEDNKFIPYKYDGIYIEDFVLDKKDTNLIIL